MKTILTLLLLAFTPPVSGQYVTGADIEEMITTEDVAATCVVMTVRAALEGSKEAAIWWMQFTTADLVRSRWAEQNAVLSATTADEQVLIYSLWKEGAAVCVTTREEVSE